VTYRFNGQQVAVREGVTLTFVYGDHLGSASLTTNITGTKVSEVRYYPFGEVRYSSGSLPSDRTFTGQRSENVGTVGNLMDYGARFYSPLLGRFISPDTIALIAGNPQIYNRYAYAANSPLNHTDSSGHCLDDVCNNSTVSHVIYTSGYISQRQYIINKYGLSSSIVTPQFVAQVMQKSRQFMLPSQLLAGSMYAELNSRNPKDDLEDGAVAAVSRCRSTCSLPDSILADVGRLFIARDQSFGPAKVKPSAVLDPDYTIPSLRQAGVGIPSDATDAAIQSLDFGTGVEFAAAYLKGLADLRMHDTPGSSGSRATDMSKVDMQVVRVAYNEGVGNFPSKQYYQSTTHIDPEGRGAEVSPWLDAFAELYGN
jgi:RHS repeat-associated protein